MSTRFAQFQAPKRLTLAFLLVAGTAFTNIPDNPTKAQIISSCVADKVTVQERVALQQCKTKLDAAELLQSMYQDRFDTSTREQTRLIGAWRYYAEHSTTAQYERDLTAADKVCNGWKAALKEINELLVTLRAEPVVTPKKKKK